MGILDLILGAIGLGGVATTLGRESIKNGRAQANADAIMEQLEAHYKNGDCPKGGFASYHLKMYVTDNGSWDGQSWRYRVDGQWWGEIYKTAHKYNSADKEASQWFWEKRAIHERNHAENPVIYCSF